jgi:hypothetical protein
MSYTASDLLNLIQKVGCERKGREFCGLCNVCQNRSIHINPGKRKVAIIVCNVCGIDKKDDVIKSLGLTWNDFGPELLSEEITKIWNEAFPDLIGNIADDSVRLDVAKTEVCHIAYSYLTNHKYCKLTFSHRQWLESRGLPADYATKINYGSTPTIMQSQQIANEIYFILKDDLYKVPGFVKNKDKPEIRLIADGIFHPCRNVEGEITSVKIRKPNATSKDRLITMSSAYNNGPSAIARCHVPLGVKDLPNTDTVWVTEGERKADVVFYKKNVAVIGVPGTNNVSMALQTLSELNCKTVIFALDKDNAGNYATLKLRYEHHLHNIDREFYFADWDVGQPPQKEEHENTTRK